MKSMTQKSILAVVLFPIVGIVFFSFANCAGSSKKTADTVVVIQKSETEVALPQAEAKQEGVSVSTKSILKQRIAQWDGREAYNFYEEVEDLYAKNVNYYGKDVTRSQIQSLLAGFFEKNFDYSQHSYDLQFEQIDPTIVRCDFTKTTNSFGKQKTYPSYLYFQNINGEWRIIRESDNVTDKNLKK